jgi:hypothetical protein
MDLEVQKLQIHCCVLRDLISKTDEMIAGHFRRVHNVHRSQSDVIQALEEMSLEKSPFTSIVTLLDEQLKLRSELAVLEHQISLKSSST